MGMQGAASANSEQPYAWYWLAEQVVQGWTWRETSSHVCVDDRPWTLQVALIRAATTCNDHLSAPAKKYERKK